MSSDFSLLVIVINEIVLFSLRVGFVFDELGFVNPSINKLFLRQSILENVEFLLHIKTVEIFCLDDLFARE